MTITTENCCMVCNQDDSMVSGVVGRGVVSSCNHTVCSKCFLRIMSLCYCNKKYGEVIYVCPMCRSTKCFSNKEIHDILMDITGASIAHFEQHSVCKHAQQIPDTIRKCEFKNCGCREHIVDLKIETTNLSELSFETLIERYLQLATIN